MVLQLLFLHFLPLFCLGPMPAQCFGLVFGFILCLCATPTHRESSKKQPSKSKLKAALAKLLLYIGQNRNESLLQKAMGTALMILVQLVLTKFGTVLLAF